MIRKLSMFMAFLLIGVSFVLAQTKVTGKVTSSEDGSPVIGATVVVEGTKIATLTDVSGHFTLSNVPASAKGIKVSYIGMESQRVRPAARLNIQLSRSVQQLGESVVVAYGVQKKQSLTGAVSAVDSKTLEQRVVGNVTNALTGEIPGIQVVSSSGAPGSNALIRIRGIGSLSASSAPLYIVDGTPYDGDLNAINPQDIASISVLKDASANAIYGARGANGVILITTKIGKSEKPVITFDAKWGSNSRVIPRYNTINDPKTYYEVMFNSLYNSKVYAGKSKEEAYDYALSNLFDTKNGGLGYQVFTMPDGEPFIGTDLRMNPNATLGYSDGEYYYTPDDWYKAAFRNSFRQQYDFSASGRSGKFDYFTSVGYLDDSGIIKNSQFERYSGRTKVDYQAKEWLKFGTNMAFTHTISHLPSGDTPDFPLSSGNIFFVTSNMGAIYPLYVRDKDGNMLTNPNTGYVYDAPGVTNFTRPSVVGNAVRDNIVNKITSYIDGFSGKWYAELKPVKGLTLTATLATTLRNSRSSSLDSRFGSSLSVDGSVGVSNSRLFAFTNQYLANYTTTIAENHHINALVGYERYTMKSQYLSGSNDHLYNPFIGELNNATGTSKKTVTSYTNNYMTEGILSRLEYDYNNKYFVSASYRRDASSRFAKGHRWGDFGSIGGAWLISAEDFMQPYKWVNELKLRASWGVQGNDNLGNYYPYADQYKVSYSEETGNYANVLEYKGNPDITWETNYAFNIATDFSLFKRRLEGTIEFFNRKTVDMLYYQQQPLSSGIKTKPINVGSMYNRGVEFNLNAVVLDYSNLFWTANVNLTHFVNKITALDPAVEATGIKHSWDIWKIGGSAYNSYLPKYAGVDPETGKAQYYKNPDAGDYELTTNYEDARQSDLGSTLPKLSGGLGTNLRVHNFDLGVQLSFQLGGKVYDGAYQQMVTTGGGTAGNAWHKDILSAWTPEHTITDVPRMSTGDNTYDVSSSRFLVSSDYLSFNNVTIGYSFPTTTLQKWGFNKLRVYVAGENLAVLTTRVGLDPRFMFGIGSKGRDSGAGGSSYNSMRTITAGISVSF